MAIALELVGFEGQDYTGITDLGNNILTPFSARTGAIGMHCQPAGASNFGVSIGATGRQVGQHNSYAIFLQFWVKFETAPNDVTSMFCGVENGDTLVSMDPDRTWKLTHAGLGTVKSNQIVPLGVDFRVMMKTWTFDIFPGTFGTLQLRTTVEFLHRDPTTGAIDYFDYLEITGDNLSNHNYFRGIVGSSSGVGAGSPTWSFHVDDVIYMAVDTLTDLNSVKKWGVKDSHGVYIPNFHTLDTSQDPEKPSVFIYDKIYPIPITAQGRNDTWTPAGNAAVIAPLPSSTARVPLSTSNGVGAWTSYKHQQVLPQFETWFYQDGITHVPPLPPIILPNEIEGWEVKGNAVATPSSSQLITDDFPPDSPLSPLTNLTAQGNESSPRSIARFIPGPKGLMMPVSQFNGIQMGIKNVSGDLVKLTNLFMEVLMGPGLFLAGVHTTPSTQSVTPGAAPGLPGPEALILRPDYQTEACADPPDPRAGSGTGTGCDI